MTDAVAAAIWFAINLFAVAAAHRLARQTFPTDTRQQLAMHMLVVLWATIAAGSQLLGALGALGAVSLGITVSAVSLAVHLALARRSRITSPTNEDSALDCASTDSRLREKFGGGIGSASEFSRILLRGRYMVAVLIWVPLAAVAVAIVVVRLLRFPKHWDDLMYHLPLVNHWLQVDALYVPGCCEWYNPGNGELLGLWLVAPFSGDFWIGAANLPIACLLALSTLELGRCLNIAPLARHGTAVAALATNVVLTQIADLENDLAVVAVFTAALAYGARFARDGRRPDCWWAAIGLGLLAGVKYYALGYAAIASTALFAVVCAKWGAGSAMRFMWRVISATLLLSGYWYARNWIVTGTPFYPLGFSNATDVLDSVRPGTFETTFLGNGRIDLWLQYVDALGQVAGPCQVAAFVLAPSLALWMAFNCLVRLWRQEARSDVLTLRLTLAALLLGGVLVFALTPFAVADHDGSVINGAFTVVRYSQCSVLLSLLVLSVLLTDMGVRAKRCLRRWQWNPDTSESGLRRHSTGFVAYGCAVAGKFAGVVWTLAAVAQMISRCRVFVDLDTAFVAVDTALAMLLLCVFGAPPAIQRRMAAVGLAAAFALATTSSAWLSARWHGGYATNYDRQFFTHVFTGLQGATSPPRAIAVADYRYYPFFGSRRQFRAHRPFRIASRQELFSYVRDNEVDVLAAVRRDHFKFGRYRRVSDWIAERPDLFRKIAAGGSFDVYRVLEMREREGLSTGTQRGSISAADAADSPRDGGKE